MYIRRGKTTVRKFTRPARDGWLRGTLALPMVRGSVGGGTRGHSCRLGHDALAG
jgi:hypothetical protein